MAKIKISDSQKIQSLTREPSESRCNRIKSMRNHRTELHAWYSPRVFFKALAVMLIALGAMIPSVSQAASKSINETSNNKVVSVKVGSTFSVILNSTYWEYTPMTSSKVVTAVGAPVATAIMPSATAPAGCTIAGSGCGTVTWKFKAKAVGTAVIAASRTSCGEAMRCTAENGSYSVKIKVTR